MLQVEISPERLRHAKWETNLDHAKLKATKEVINKTKDEEHTFLMTEHLDETTIIIWAQNMNNPNGKTTYSRSYLVAVPWVVEE